MKTINDKVIEKTRVIKCSINTLWWKWTTHAGLLTFFGSDNKIDFKLGGSYEIYFLLDNPDGLKGGEGNKIISYSPKEMLSFTWNAPPNYPEIRNHLHTTWVVVNFKPVNETHTKITLKHLGWLTGEEWDRVYNYFDSAWATVLDSLEDSCNK